MMIIDSFSYTQGVTLFNNLVKKSLKKPTHVKPNDPCRPRLDSIIENAGDR